MIHTVRHNFKSNKKYEAEDHLCPDCLALVPPEKHPDTQEQLLHCKGNKDLRRGKDLGDERDEAQFYREVITRRNQRYEE